MQHSRIPPFLYIEYSAKYHNPTLTELVLQKDARVNRQNALHIATERGNKASELLIREVVEQV